MNAIGCYYKASQSNFQPSDVTGVTEAISQKVRVLGVYVKLVGAFVVAPTKKPSEREKRHDICDIAA
jgi:hypothetical protein